MTLFSPVFFAVSILILLIVFILGALFGKSDNSDDKLSAYREAAVDIALVYLPIVLYSTVHILNGTFIIFLKSPEFPVAAMILSNLAIFSLFKTAYTTNKIIPFEKLSALLIAFILLFMMCSVIIVWLVLQAQVSDWFTLINSLIAFFSTMLTFAVYAAMKYITLTHEKQ